MSFEKYAPENESLFNYKCNQNILIERRFLENLRVPGKKSKSEKCEPSSPEEFHACVNSYYEFAEDFDAVNRVEHLLHEAYSNYLSKIKSDTSEFEMYDDVKREKCPFKKDREDFYSQRLAQSEYLHRKPTCFIILGKPGLCEERLGKLLAEYWECAYIHPETLVNEEIQSGSRAGLCIEFNLRCGRSIGVDVIIRLLEKRLNSESVKHRGFVICGFPLIKNGLFSEDPVSSESAIFNVHDIFEDIFENEAFDSVKHVSRTSLVESEEEEEEIEEETKLIEKVGDKMEKLGSLSSKTGAFDLGKAPSTPIVRKSISLVKESDQIECILSLCEDFEYFIIYLKCPNEEVVNIRKDNRCDAHTLDLVNLQRERSDNVMYTLYSMYPQQNEPDIADVPITERKLLNLQRDFTAHVRSQLDSYQYDTQLVIEKYILLHDPDAVIKLDGRMAPHKLFQILRMRLKVLPISPAILPELLIDPQPLEEVGEGGVIPVQPVVDFEGMSLEDAFKVLRSRKVAGPLYRWALSEWKYKCPVHMKHFILKDGDPKFSVRFMNKVFFLADENACNKFLHNPRKYLGTMNPKVAFRVFVFGPELSGKSMISKMIQRVLDLEVIDIKEELNMGVYEKLKVYLDNVKEQAEQQAWMELSGESRRRSSVSENKYPDLKNVIFNCLRKLLRRLMETFIVVPKYKETKKTENSDDEKSLDLDESLKIPEETMDNSKGLANLLNIKEAADCLKYLQNDELLQGAILSGVYPADIFDTEEAKSLFVEEFVNEAIENENDNLENESLTTEETAQIISNLVVQLNERIENLEISGYILDGVPNDLGVLENIDLKCLPDLAVIMIDTSMGGRIKKYLSSVIAAIDKCDDIIDKVCAETNVTDLKDGDSPVPQTIKVSFDDDDEDMVSLMDNAEQEGEQSQDFEIGSYLLKCREIIIFFDEKNLPTLNIDIADKNIVNLLIKLTEKLQSLSDQAASVVTEEEKKREQQDYGDLGLEGEAPGEDVDDLLERDKQFRENRRYGDTNEYDAVALFKYGVLWRGTDKFLVQYMNKMWPFSIEKNMALFLETPSKYASSKGAVNQLPPPRICIVGSNKVGKSTQGKMLSEAYGLFYCDFEKELNCKVDEDTYRGYMEEGLALVENILSEILLPLWNSPKEKKIGFVLDGFPRIAADVEFMTQRHAIPDVLVELKMDTLQLHKRLFETLLNEWSLQMQIERDFELEQYQIQLNEWNLQREKRRRDLVEAAKMERYGFRGFGEEGEQPGEGIKFKLTKIDEVVDEEEEENVDEGSLVSFKSYQEAEDEKRIQEILDEEFIEPTLINDWETIEMATERIQDVIANSINSEPLRIAQLKSFCEAARFPWLETNGNLDIMKAFSVILQKTNYLLTRTESIFERVYDVTAEMAEKLLDLGYFFLSRFGRTCPVQMYENYNPLQMYLPREGVFQIFPMIHQNYIYFISGSEARENFRKDVLKYVKQDYKNLPMFKTRIAIIGPPRSGKSLLAERLQSEFGLSHISVGKAVRYVLNYMPSSVLAGKVSECLLNGNELSEELKMLCVECISFDFKGVAAGVVMDGFPNSIEEVKVLAKLNLAPHLFIDLHTDLNYVLQYMDIFGPTHKPEYSKKFISYRFEEWINKHDEFRDWVDREYQNLAKLELGNKWKIWIESKEIILAVLGEIKQYYKLKDKNIVFRVANMLVTPYEFLSRQSIFKEFCPLCLFYENELTFGGSPPDRTGLLQYQGRFYWVCHDHIDEFSSDPDKFLGSNVRHSLPINIPQKICLKESPDNLYFNGVCCTCLSKNKPLIVKNNGLLKFAAEFNGLIYLFDTKACLKAFLRKPLEFATTSTNFPNADYPELDMHGLPALGMLEQYTSKAIVKGLIDLNNVRPSIPGLSISQSALIYLGIFLKIQNPKTPADQLEMYKAIKANFMEKFENFQATLKELKGGINPYIHYEEKVPPYEMKLGQTLKLKRTDSSESTCARDVVDSLLTSRVPVPDERFDYLCEYHKPASKVPAFLNVVDIAGLVKGASEGQGLGNAFLSHISACDAIFHLCRVFEDDDVTHIEGDVNPVRDLEIIGEELRLKDEETMMKKLESLERTVLRGNDKKLKPEYDALVKIKGVLVEEKQHIRFHDWSANDIEVLNKYLFLTSKPALYLVNLSEKDYIKKKNKWLLKIKEWVDKNDPGAPIIPFSGGFEQKLLEMEPEERKKYLEDNKTTSALDKIIVQGYKALQLEYFFTAGPDEVKAWTIQKGTKAPQAAGRIHTDFEKGFIMAEVMKFVDFKEEGSEAAAKAAGKYRQQGRNYVVEDGDIIFFKFNAGAGLKDAKKK